MKEDICMLLRRLRFSSTWSVLNADNSKPAAAVAHAPMSEATPLETARKLLLEALSFVADLVMFGSKLSQGGTAPLSTCDVKLRSPKLEGKKSEASVRSSRVETKASAPKANAGSSKTKFRPHMM